MEIQIVFPTLQSFLLIYTLPKPSLKLMTPKSPSLQLLPLAILLLLCLLLLFPIPSNGEYICPMAPISSSCGNLINISYPFWLTYDSDPSSYCGYPAFMLLCENGTPSLRLGSDNYTVTDIDYEKHTIKLADADIFLGSSDCPRVRHNLTFLTNLTTIPNFPYNNNLTSYFNLTVDYTPSDANIAFFFNCTNGPSLPANEIECLNHLDKKSYAFNFTYGPGPPQEMHDYDLYRNCSDFVVAPVLLEYLDHLFTESAIGKYGDVLKSGFEMRWNELTHGRCSDCESSHGRCGLNQTSNSTSVFACFCSDGKTELYNCTGNVTHSSGLARKRKITVIEVSVGVAVASISLLFLFVYIIRGCKKGIGTNEQAAEAFLLQYGSIAPKRYKYSEIKRMTNCFSNKLGQGGYGSVFKGALLDGHLVAIKVLTESKGNGEDFINEVASISRTSHVNIVNLLGFCLEGKKRALVYDFMPNGSLEKFIFSDKSEIETQLGWEKLYEIAVGIARGLEYLHRGCNTHIVHFDIKPHNILLDQDFRPKISDFGLSKLRLQKESAISMTFARGTPGYIAPELVIRGVGAISSKSDVYSYGMMILEMVGGRKNFNACAENTSEIYFPEWVYDNLDKYCSISTPNMTGEIEDTVRKMIMVGLWCIQLKPGNRPSISMVVKMLEGSIGDLEMPPKLFAFEE
ncbi:hypothetical protein Cni_G26375 [Canna indica]|uniref:Protein kinase domain-containing protein n=1 Tax=Canna indica TaxID=4628 RepID=A0AAQ3L605_9LILI|nr:hypothetical protein Cni_G26375 [Canna indica]